MVQKRKSWFLKTKASPKPSWERDVPFWTITDSDRGLLCDIWRLADGKISGLAFIFFHGSDWGTLDKDRGTRFFFRHLTAQGRSVSPCNTCLFSRYGIDQQDNIRFWPHVWTWSPRTNITFIILELQFFYDISLII